MEGKSILINENERTMKKIKRELYILYADRLLKETFHEEFVSEIEHYIQTRIKEEEAKMNWFSVVWTDTNVEKDFAVSVKVIVNSEKDLTIRLSLKAVPTAV